MEKRGVRVLVGHLTTCASAAGACGAAARPKAEYTRAAAPRVRRGEQQARVRRQQRTSARGRNPPVTRFNEGDCGGPVFVVGLRIGGNRRTPQGVRRGRELSPI